MKSYASYKLPFVVYDLGTATTANIVNENGYFLGGAILPGIDTGLMSLNKNTAMLPKAVPSSNIPLIGKNTNECLLSGVIYSTASFIDNYTNEINKELGNIATVIITGGNASKIIPFLKTDVIYCPDLLLEGLFLLYPKLKKEGFHENKK
jgi:type III pantothenate kinase